MPWPRSLPDPGHEALGPIAVVGVAGTKRIEEHVFLDLDSVGKGPGWQQRKPEARPVSKHRSDPGERRDRCAVQRMANQPVGPGVDEFMVSMDRERVSVEPSEVTTSKPTEHTRSTQQNQTHRERGVRLARIRPDGSANDAAVPPTMAAVAAASTRWLVEVSITLSVEFGLFAAALDAVRDVPSSMDNNQPRATIADIAASR